MTGSRPAIALIVGFLMLWFGGAAGAQEDLSAGKTAQQLFRLNCAACHSSPAGLAGGAAKAGGLLGLEHFLAQHYTASGRSAQLIADYLKSLNGAAAARRSRPTDRSAARPRKPAAEQTESAKKTEAGKKTDAKTSDKPDKTKAGEANAKADAKATDDKAASDKGDAPKADKPKMSEPKPDKKEAAAPATEAKRENPKPGGAAADKKTN